MCRNSTYCVFKERSPLIINNINIYIFMKKKKNTLFCNYVIS